MLMIRMGLKIGKWIGPILLKPGIRWASKQLLSKNNKEEAENEILVSLFIISKISNSLKRGRKMGKGREP
jgi:hypothetical protein